MKSTKLRSFVLLLLSLVTLALSGHGGLVLAATAKTNKPTVNNNSNTLKVSPVRSDTIVAAGTSGTVTTFVTNLTGATVLLKPIENDFIAGDEKGTPALILDENSYAPTHSLKRFMVPLSTFQVAPGATKQVDVTIRVPQGAQSGGYYGAIRFAPVASTNDKSVNLNASVASLILMTVPGDLQETLAITNFDVQQNGGTASNFRNPDNLSLLLRFKNTGNVQLSPFGQIYIQKGKKVVYSYNFNDADPKQSILPDTARRWEIPIKNLGKFGKYTVGATFTYGTKGQSLEIKKTIWIIPTTYILGAIGAFIALILVIWFIWAFLRSYKRRILRGRRRY